MKHHMMKNIKIISRCSTLYLEERLKGSGLSGIQATYIPEIIWSPGINQDQLAQKLHVNKSNVARQLFMLEENDFIERRRCENDRRVMEVFPTEKAIAVEKKIREANSEWRRALFADMTEEERELLEEVLDRLARRAEALG